MDLTPEDLQQDAAAALPKVCSRGTIRCSADSEQHALWSVG